MMSRVLSCATLGINAYIVHIENDLDRQIPAFSVVGLPDNAVKESRDRVIAAIRNSGRVFPNRRVTVNLAPADIRKEGSAFDLPIAVGILAAAGAISPEILSGYAILGELSLDGGVRPVRGVLPMAVEARRAGLKGMILARENAREAAIAGGLAIHPVNDLIEALEFLEGYRHHRPLPDRHRPDLSPRRWTTASTSGTSGVRNTPNAHWRSPPQADTTSS